MTTRRVLGIGVAISLAWWVICGLYFGISQSELGISWLVVIGAGGLFVVFLMLLYTGVIKLLPPATNLWPELIPFIVFSLINITYMIILVNRFGIWPEEIFYKVWVWLPTGSSVLLLAFFLLALLSRFVKFGSS